MIRVVLDTNIILSSLLQPLGPPAKVFYLARCGFLNLCMSGPVYAEYEEVLQRPRFRRIQEAIQPTLEFVRKNGLWVRTTDWFACAATRTTTSSSNALRLPERLGSLPAMFRTSPLSGKARRL